MGEADDFKKPLDPEPTLRCWAEAAQRRNVQSLAAGAGPGGPPLAPNRPATVRRKGHDRVGIDSGEMAHGLVDPAAVNLKVTRDGGEAQVFGGSGATDKKLNIFIQGQRPQKRWTSEQTKSGKRRAWQYDAPAVPGRDFFGVDERDSEAAGEFLLDDVARQMGFK